MKNNLWDVNETEAEMLEQGNRLWVDLISLLSVRPTWIDVIQEEILLRRRRGHTQRDRKKRHEFERNEFKCRSS